jgi:predicted DNA-binding antitoxin AbrB/MazE fold protein
VQQTVPAIFEDGVLKPLRPLNLAEHQTVEVTVTPAGPSQRSPEQTLAAWRAVFDGLSSEDVDEVERVALDRRHFSSSTH